MKDLGADGLQELVKIISERMEVDDDASLLIFVMAPVPEKPGKSSARVYTNMTEPGLRKFAANLIAGVGEQNLESSHIIEMETGKPHVDD